MPYSDLWKFNPITLEWTWVKGNGLTNQAAVYGIKGVPDPANTPGRRCFASVTWVDTSGNLWLFGGGTSGLSTQWLNDLWKYDIATNQWIWVSGSNTVNAVGVHGTQGVPSILNVPGATIEQSCSWVDSLNNLWMFGAANMNDLWRYTIATTEWTWIKGTASTNAAPVYGTKYVSSTTNDPGTRTAYAKWKDKQGNFWLMGGISGSVYNIDNDVWRYTTNNNEWTWMSGAKTFNDTGTYRATCIFDTINLPRSRTENRAAITDNCGRFWMFGGCSRVSLGLPVDYLNDLWIFDSQTNKWKWISGTNIINQPNSYGTLGVPSPSNKPSSRWGSVAWWGNDNKFYMFGGSQNNGSSCYADIWVFNPDTNCIPNCSVSILAAHFISSDTTFCEEPVKCINFTDHSSGNPTSWKWLFPGATPNNSTQQNPTNICYYAPGTYSVTLIITNAAGSDTLTVSPMITVGSTPNPPVITKIGLDTLICSHASSYQWFFNGSPIVGATDSFYVATQPGNYSVQITDSFGCNRLSNGVFVSVDEISEQTLIAIYPNPTTSSSILQLNAQLKDAEVVIYDMLGKEIVRKKLTGNRMEIEKGSLESGVYFVRVSTEERQYVQKIIIE